MENVYSEEDISKMRNYVKQHGCSSNYLEPGLYLVSTLLLLFFVLYLMTLTKNYNAILIVLLALVNLRLFMIFHDSCHKSYLPSDERAKDYNGVNYKLGKLLEPWCMYTVETWTKIHSQHHKAHGNTNEYDGTRTVLTSGEYNDLDDRLKTLYDILRFPPLFFLVAPLYIFWISRIIYFDVEYIIKYSLWLLVLYKIGSSKLMFSFIIAQYIAGVIGLILFHLQHQVNTGYWKPIDKNDKLSKDNAELLGASVLKIPYGLDYFTNGIEYHNVHHLDPGVPCYKTQQIYYDLVNKGWIPDTKINYREELKSLGHTIFNEITNKYE